MLKTVVLHNIFVETVINCIFQDSLINRKFKRTLFEIEIFCNIVFTVTFDQFNGPLQNKSYSFYKKAYLSSVCAVFYDACVSSYTLVLWESSHSSMLICPFALVGGILGKSHVHLGFKLITQVAVLFHTKDRRRKTELTKQGHFNTDSRGYISYKSVNIQHECERVYLRELRLGQSRLAHLWRLAHGDVALGQWTLREGLGHQVLTGLAAWCVGQAIAVITSATVPLTTSTTPGLTFRSTTTCKQTREPINIVFLI